MGILFDKLLEYVKERIFKNDVETEDSNFNELLLKIFEEKIFPLHKVNFMQYLPFYVMCLIKETEDEKIIDKCRMFSERFLSFLVLKAFDQKGQHREHLSIRQHAWNYVVSLISRECSILKTSLITKCLQIILKFFEKNYAK